VNREERTEARGFYGRSGRTLDTALLAVAGWSILRFRPESELSAENASSAVGIFPSAGFFLRVVCSVIAIGTDGRTIYVQLGF
jgi:hypothetical protein